MPARRDSGRTIALVGGGILAAWLLLRGKGSRADLDSRDGSAPAREGLRAIVWIRAGRLEVDGVVADLATVVARCRAVGRAEVHASGDAVEHDVREVLTALHTAGVTLYTPPDLANV